MRLTVLGVDEAGRGPLAGPVSVGVVAVSANFNVREHFPGVADSKALTEEKREALFECLEQFQNKGVLRYTVVFASSKKIDQIGIVKAVQGCVYTGVRRLAPDPGGVEVLRDGLLHAPPAYTQKTSIRGDETEAIISLASIAAKVTRDRLMKKISSRYPQYGFAAHKGYGTLFHRTAIEAFGLSNLHRRSFCSRIFTFQGKMIG